MIKPDAFTCQTITSIKIIYKGIQIFQRSIFYISDAAIKNFPDERGKQRQYQYRAQIEASAGHYEAAFDYLKKGLAYDNVKDMFAPGKQNFFGMYHLSSLVKQFINEEGYENEIDEMIKLFSAERKNIESKSFPCFLLLGNIAEALTFRKGDKMQIHAFYRSALKMESNVLLFRIFKLCIQASYLAWLKDADPSYVKDLEKEMRNTCTELWERAKGLSEGLTDMIRNLQDILDKGSDKKELFLYSQRRQY